MLSIVLHSPIHKNQRILVKWKDINMQTLFYIRSLIYANSLEEVKEAKGGSIIQRRPSSLIPHIHARPPPH